MGVGGGCTRSRKFVLIVFWFFVMGFVFQSGEIAHKRVHYYYDDDNLKLVVDLYFIKTFKNSFLAILKCLNKIFTF